MAKRFKPVGREAYVTSGFGPRWGAPHRGLDFGREGGSAGMAVYAAQGGIVVYSGAASGFGGPAPAGWLVIDHSDADGSGATVYGHIIAEVAQGARVEAGQRIARVNPNSATNGGVPPHLHFEVHPHAWAQGSQIDPAGWLAGAEYPGDARHGAADPAPAAPGNVLFGVDVSEHQNGMSLKQAAAEGMSYAIIRTTDGTYKDSVYLSHLQDAESAGMVTAAYHYLRNPSEGTTVAQQVQASVDVMGDHKRPVWIDAETPAGLNVENLRACKREFEQRGIRVIGMYSYVPYWENSIFPGEPDSHEFGAFWVAAYGNNPQGAPAAIYPGAGHRQWQYPLGNQKPVLWQFGSNAQVAGFAVDINAFHGTRDQLKALFYGQPVTPDKVTDVKPPEPVTRPPLEAPPLPVPPTPVPANPVPDKPAATPAPAKRRVMDVLLDAMTRVIVGKPPV